MSEVMDYRVVQIDIEKAKPFCRKWHYSGTLPGCKYYFGLYRADDLIGIAAYGVPAMMKQAACYHCDLELRRLCLIDETPKNAESRFIGMTLRILKRLGHLAVLSLSDPEHGHTGTVYRASNFEYLGKERGGGSRLIIIDGIVIHSRSAFAKYGTSGVNSLKRLLGEEHVVGRNKERKNVYRFVLKKN